MGNKLSIDGVMFVGSKAFAENNPWEVLEKRGCTEVDWYVRYSDGRNFRRTLLLPEGNSDATINTVFLSRYISSNCSSFEDQYFTYVQGNSGDSRPLVAPGSTILFDYVPGCLGLSNSSFRSCYTDEGYWQSYNHMSSRGVTVYRRAVSERRIEDVRPGAIEACFLEINYEDGTTFEFGEVACDAEIFLVEDEFCPKTCKLADAILTELGQGNEL